MTIDEIICRIHELEECVTKYIDAEERKQGDEKFNKLLEKAKTVKEQKIVKIFQKFHPVHHRFAWVHDGKKGVGTFRGVYGQNLYINQDEKIVIATFSSAASASNAARASNKPRMAAFEAIAAKLK